LGFADLGDAYYDIAIAIETIENESELNAFLNGYTIKKIDLERSSLYAKSGKFY